MFWFSVLAVGTLATGSPVSHIVQLLNDLKVQVAREGEEEKTLYDKFMCWCDKGVTESTAALADQKSRIETLAPAVTEKKALVETLAEEVEEVSKAVAGHQQGLETARALREKEQATFDEDTGVLRKSVAGLAKALAVMRKAADAGVFAQVAPSVRAALLPLATRERVRTALDDRQVKALLAGVSFLQVRDSAGAFSGGIAHVTGVLQGLEDGFKQDLATAEKREKDSLDSFNALTASKGAELSAAQQNYQRLAEEKAQNAASLAQMRDDLAATQVSYAQDAAVHKDRVKQCATKTGEFHARQQARLSELLAITEATQVLNENAAAFEGAPQPTPCPVPLECPVSFLQLGLAKTPDDVLAYLEKLASANPESKMLGLLATKLSAMSGQNFDRVIQVINKQIELLDMDQTQDDMKKSWCDTEESKTVAAIALKEKEAESLKVNIGEVEGQLSQLRGEVETFVREIHELDDQEKDASQNRADEARSFDKTIADVKTAQRALVKAIQVLEAFYGQQGSALAALQEQQRARLADAARAVVAGASVQPEPETPDGAYAGGEGGKKIIALLAAVGEDLVKQEEAARAAEEEAVKELQVFQSQTALGRKMKQEQLLARRQQVARFEENEVSLGSDLEAAEQGQKQLQEQHIELTKSCAMVQQYEKRKELRAAERAAMQKAIGILQ